MKFWQELRRRRVYRLAALYIVGAWLSIQVGDIFFPAWGVPDTALRYLIMAAALCFPIALVFGWFFDITSGGIVRTRDAGMGETVDLKLGGADYLLLVALAGIALAILVGSVEKIRDTSNEAIAAASTEKPEYSVAVLPFENMDPNTDTGYFSDGISEEILYKLSSVSGLKVLGRTSSFAFKDSDLGVPRISDILGVRYLLSGSVRREANTVRLTASLTDDEGFQVWGATFDGELDGVFQLQSRIAEQVAKQISDELTPPTVAARETQNVEAYQQYLIGREYFHERPPNWQEPAAEAFRSAIDEDPTYAPPYVGLADALTINVGTRAFRANKGTAYDAIARALDLDPTLPEAYASRGRLLIYADEPELEAAVSDLEKSLQLNPTQAMAYNWLANAYGRLNRNEDAENAYDRGLAIDPLNPPLVFNTSDRYVAANDYDGAILHISKLLDLPEPPGNTYSMLSNLFASSGRLPDAVSWTKEAIRANGGSTGMGELSYLYDLLGMTADGDYWFEQDEARQSDPLVLLLHQIETLLFRGDLEGAAEKLRRFDARDGFDLEDYPPGIEYYFAPFYAQFGRPETGVEMLEAQLGKNGNNIATEDDVYDAIMRLYTLAYAYEKTGQPDNAQITRKRALALGDEIGKDRPFGKNPENLFVLAFGFAANGDVENASLTLKEAVASGWRGYYEKINDPFMRDAFSAPKYDAIFDDVKAEVDRQREIVEAADAEHDFRAEFEQLVTERSQQQSP